MRHRDWVRCVEQALWRAAPGRACMPSARYAPGPRHAVSTPGDLLFHIRAKRMDLCFELATQIMARIGDVVSPEDEVHGFRYFDDRDIIGFVDGTENPRAQAAMEAVLIGEEDPAFAGGSYVIVQKYLHDLDGWNALSTETQEQIIGRTKLSDIELDDSIKPTSAHNALTTITEDGKEVKILRDNMPFGRAAPVNLALTSLATAVRRAGLSKCSRTCSSAVRPATMTGCSTSAARSREACSSCPPRHFLKLSRRCARGCEAFRSAGAGKPMYPCRRKSDGSLGIGSLKGDIPHE